MKIILSQLNKLINELEDQKRFAEANQLEDVFMRLAKKVKKKSRMRRRVLRSHLQRDIQKAKLNMLILPISNIR